MADPAQLAAGGNPGTGAPQNAPIPSEIPAVATGAPPQGGDIQQMIPLLEAAIQQAVDQEGFVDLDKLIAIWPQIAQQAGIEVPFEVVMQMVAQQPEALTEIIQKLGLAGLTKDGQKIPAEQLKQAAQGQEQFDAQQGPGAAQAAPQPAQALA
jgi:hypothetical protein